jgi:hypothetical protein
MVPVFCVTPVAAATPLMVSLPYPTTFILLPLSLLITQVIPSVGVPDASAPLLAVGGSFTLSPELAATVTVLLVA